jgi:hypothetical protein
MRLLCQRAMLTGLSLVCRDASCSPSRGSTSCGRRGEPWRPRRVLTFSLIAALRCVNALRDKFMSALEAAGRCRVRCDCRAETALLELSRFTDPAVLSCSLIAGRRGPAPRRKCSLSPSLRRPVRAFALHPGLRCSALGFWSLLRPCCRLLYPVWPRCHICAAKDIHMLTAVLWH